jgi:hypothetical protein
MALSSVDSLVIDRALKGTMFDSVTGEMLFNLEMIKDPSLECSGTLVYSDDHLGAHIASFSRAKEAKFSATNALFNLSLAAAQYGSTKVVASSGTKMNVPIYEEHLVGGAPNTTITLANIPVHDSVLWIYKVSKQHLSTAYPAAVSESASAFKIVEGTGVITLPTLAFAATDTVAIWYQYATATAVSVENSSSTFAKRGRFDLEVLMCDPCDQDTKYYAHIVFANAQLENGGNIKFTTDGDHAFSLVAIQDYCTSSQQLFNIIIPEVAA